ncbi:class I adenylate-forming enzyme family protein [Herbivorax sp. ANBcel31]|uniref:class I adenylate-forming enzyme family protein n=1 Tax=Herbivorax sp. ANBcel31 TaxID=3069754 RepID=UPI0027B51A6B|nr:class I adenylate-forming enzyme family protein [Herbivorax sp. ANBcel31]MDQ2086120.1 class I adenylate-forming enzyme family protein [Herbivorax sp. ANBcel31]
MNYCDFLFDTDGKYLDNEAIVDVEKGERFSFKELQNAVLKVADFLKSKGYEPGMVISTHLYNGAETAIVLLAAQYIGCVICLIDPLYKADELPYYIEDSGSSCIVTHLKKKSVEDVYKGDVEIFEEEEIRQVYKNTDKSICKKINMYEFDKDELAMLLYTSGSTSTPKAVMLSTGCYNVFLEKSNMSMYRYKNEDKLLCFVPFSHAFGSISLLIPALAHKAAVVFLRSFHPLKVADTISKENITHIYGVPTHYKQLLRYESNIKDLRKLKAAFCAAAPLSYDTAKLWFDKVGIYLDEGYGLSEACTLIATRISKLPEPSGNVGFPPEGILEIEAVNENGEVMEEGIIGELRVRGKGLMLGYLNRPQETSERMKDGWLYTGDFGYKRSNGSYVVCGRKTEFINVAGLKISPIEIEAALNSYPDVVDSAAFGVSDSLYGEVVKACVVLEEGAVVNERDLIKYLSGKIANFKLPKKIEFIDKLPRNNVGKIDKKALKSQKTM